MTTYYLMAISSIDGPGYALVNRTVDGKLSPAGWTEDLYVENCEYAGPASALFLAEERETARAEFESRYGERDSDNRPYFRCWVEYTPAHRIRAEKNTAYVEAQDEEFAAYLSTQA